MTHCKLFKIKEYMSAPPPHLTPCCISCILKPLHLYSPSAYDCWLCTLHCRSTSLSPSITCVGMIYPVTTGSHFGPPPVTHLRWHLPAKVQLCHWFSSSVSPPTQSTSCPTPLCHQGLNLSLLMEPATVSLYKLPQICDLSYVCWPLLLRKIGSVLSRSERNTRGSGLCKAVTSHCTSHSWAVCLV